MSEWRLRVRNDNIHTHRRDMMTQQQHNTIHQIILLSLVHAIIVCHSQTNWISGTSFARFCQHTYTPTHMSASARHINLVSRFVSNTHKNYIHETHLMRNLRCHAVATAVSASSIYHGLVVGTLWMRWVCVLCVTVWCWNRKQNTLHNVEFVGNYRLTR